VILLNFNLCQKELTNQKIEKEPKPTVLGLDNHPNLVKKFSKIEGQKGANA